MEFIYRENEIVLESPEGKTLARVTFPALDAETVEIDHTFVDDSLRGQGVAGKLLEAAAAELVSAYTRLYLKTEGVKKPAISSILRSWELAQRVKYCSTAY